MAIKLPRKLKKALKKAVLQPDLGNVWKTKELKIVNIEKNFRHWKKLPTVGNITVTSTELNSKTIRRFRSKGIKWDAEKIKKREFKKNYTGTEIVDMICLPIKNALKHPMNKELSECLVRLYLGSSSRLFDMVPADEIPFEFNVILKNIKYRYSFTCNDHRVIIFLALVAESPGFAIMLLWYIQYWCFSNNIKEVTLELFATQIFPDGFPSKADLQQIWDNQKTADGKNLVDINEAGASIQF